MVFSSIEFLFFFLPIVLLIYIFLRPQQRNLWLLIASLVFYLLGSKEYFFLLLIVIVLTYLGGILVSKVKAGNKKVVMILFCAAILSIMLYYKYYDFVVVNINKVSAYHFSMKNIALPIGISFFSFQAVSYIVDVYRGEEALINPLELGLYISFFPQLIAGPIVRYKDFKKYVEKKNRELYFNKVSEGVWRFSIGMSKKVLIANNLGGLVGNVFGKTGEVGYIDSLSTAYAWLGSIAFMLQIYYDFSGYSDMAIGLGKIFGFEFYENFNRPYTAESIKDFWRKWHISLSQFFRDYVYIPLGGNRCSKIRWICNIMFVWTLTGFWHGASWNYIFWGICYGVLLIIESLFNRSLPKVNNVFGTVIRKLLTLVIIEFLWVIFKCKDLETAFAYIKIMLGVDAYAYIDKAFYFQIKNYLFLILIAIIFASSITKRICDKYFGKLWFKIVVFIFMVVSYVVSISCIYMGSYNPFLYFMF